MIQNPTSGEQYRRGWHPEIVPKSVNTERDVLVVGAGPAGMECAITLAKRGLRRVHLVEADTELGGIWRWISRLPHLQEWARVISYRTAQLDKLKKNVEIVKGIRLSASDVLEYGADVAVIANGSHWATDGRSFLAPAGLAGADSSLPHVLTPEQIMLEGKSPEGERVVVIDCDSYFTGPGIAELLAQRGHRVEIVTPFDTVAQLCEPIQKLGLYPVRQFLKRHIVFF